jgi:3-hydroxyisobutyrate dehydrogenase
VDGMTNSADGSPHPRVAILGTGTMGSGMARNIAQSGLELRAWNRNRDKAEPLTKFGATVTDSAAEAVDGSDVVVTMLFDAASVEEVMRSTAGHLGPRTVWAQMCTVGVDGATKLASVAEQLGVRFVDAPVLGTKKPAEDGTLVVLASGPEDARPSVEPIFDAVGSRTLWVGAAGAGSRLKLVANAWILTLLEGMTESLKLAEGLGLDPALFLKAVEGGPLDLPYLRMKANAMLSGSFDPAFSVDGAAKDSDLIIQAARDAAVDMPITDAARRYLHKASDAGHGDKDMSAVYLVH